MLRGEFVNPKFHVDFSKPVPHRGKQQDTGVGVMRVIGNLLKNSHCIYTFLTPGGILRVEIATGPVLVGFLHRKAEIENQS